MCVCLRNQCRDLRSLIGDRRSLGIMLVVGRDIAGRRNDVREIAAQTFAPLPS